MADLEPFKKEYGEVLNQLSDPELISNWEKLQELSRRKAYLEEILEKEKEINETKDKIEESRAIISSGQEPELTSLAEEELKALKETKENLEKELEKLVERGGPKEESAEQAQEPKAVIMEIRAGTGGKEASLFAGDLFGMYSKYAEAQGWKQKILDSHPTELGGFKEIVFELRGEKVFSKMKKEAGVHRVQRIPETEKSGRIHTSTATVAVLQKPTKTQVKISPDELKIDFYRASGPGGQYVNTRETAVRATHLPTGLQVSSQSERNQLQNKENAMSLLRAKLLQKKQEEEVGKISDKRRAQIGGAERAEKIRTYNFPQDRITDHRIKKTFHNIEGVIQGELEPIINSLSET